MYDIFPEKNQISIVYKKIMAKEVCVYHITIGG